VKCRFCQNRLTGKTDVVVVRYSATNNGLSCRNESVFKVTVKVNHIRERICSVFAPIVELVTTKLHGSLHCKKSSRCVLMSKLYGYPIAEQNEDILSINYPFSVLKDM
jgi:hypothetical protein